MNGNARPDYYDDCLMEFWVIPLVALVASGLTLFSGFGLGTILTPAFAVFFPLELAVPMTAVVHFANNLFKLGLLGRKADRGAVLRFGIPAVAASFAGAWLLFRLADVTPLFQYSLGGRTCSITAVGAAIAVLIVLFALWELVPQLAKLSFDARWLPAGGLLSGFFGGLSGHQGALRSAFLLRTGLSKEAFVATGVVLACMVDVSRLVVYGIRAPWAGIRSNVTVLLLAVAAAFLGALVGNRLLKKMTLRAVQVIVAVLLLAIAAGLGSGLIASR